jgi:hypothetical protein
VERSFKLYAPKGTRTPVLALRGPRPGPLDDGGVKRVNSTMHPPPSSTNSPHLRIRARRRMSSIPVWEGPAVPQLLQRTFSVKLISKPWPFSRNPSPNPGREFNRHMSDWLQVFQAVEIPAAKFTKPTLIDFSRRRATSCSCRCSFNCLCPLTDTHPFNCDCNKIGGFYCPPPHMLVYVAQMVLIIPIYWVC